MSFKNIQNIIVNVMATALQFQKSNFIQITGTIGLTFFPNSVKKVRWKYADPLKVSSLRTQLNPDIPWNKRPFKVLCIWPMTKCNTCTWVDPVLERRRYWGQLTEWEHKWRSKVIPINIIPMLNLLKVITAWW